MAARGELTEQAYSTAKQRLLNGEYKAGDRISVEQLVAELGTNRQPVMDALKRLATERFIEIIPQVGHRVVVTKREEMLDFFRLLAATEAICAALAAERADKEGAADLAEINQSIGRLLTADIDDQTRARRYRVLNRDFHSQLNALARSDILSPIAAFLWDHSDFYVSSAFAERILMERLHAAYAEHEKICRTIAANDADSARHAMEEHVLAFVRSVGCD